MGSLHNKTRMFWLEQRAIWLAKAPAPTSDELRSQQQRDKFNNPHNDSYKPPLRGTTEIVADLAMAYADGVLTRIYGNEYKEYLKTLQFNGRYNPETVDYLFRCQEVDNA